MGRSIGTLTTSPGCTARLSSGLRFISRSPTRTGMVCAVPSGAARMTYRCEPASFSRPPASDRTCNRVRGPSISYTPGLPTAPITDTFLLPYSRMNTETCGSCRYFCVRASRSLSSTCMAVRPRTSISPRSGREIVPLSETRTVRFSSGISKTLISRRSSAPTGWSAAAAGRRPPGPIGRACSISGVAGVSWGAGPSWTGWSSAPRAGPSVSGVISPIRSSVRLAVMDHLEGVRRSERVEIAHAVIEIVRRVPAQTVGARLDRHLGVRAVPHRRAIVGQAIVADALERIRPAGSHLDRVMVQRAPVADLAAHAPGEILLVGGRPGRADEVQVALQRREGDIPVECPLQTRRSPETGAEMALADKTMVIAAGAIPRLEHHGAGLEIPLDRGRRIEPEARQDGALAGVAALGAVLEGDARHDALQEEGRLGQDAHPAEHRQRRLVAVQQTDRIGHHGVGGRVVDPLAAQVGLEAQPAAAERAQTGGDGVVLAPQTLVDLGDGPLAHRIELVLERHEE